MNDTAEKCWICGDFADTREHRIKRTDIRQVLGEATQNKPLFVHDDGKRNRRVQSTNAKVLRGKKDLCAKCNNEFTQPHDKSWERLSFYLYENWPGIIKSGAFRVSKAFPKGARKGMRDVHLFFAKSLGCAAKEGNVSINMDKLAHGIKTNKPIDNFWLSIGETPEPEKDNTIGRTDLLVTNEKKTGNAVALSMVFTFGGVSVLVEFSISNDLVLGTKESWHPKCGTKLITLSKFNDDKKIV
ncbi:MAG: hypothetical protein ABW166_11525 [Sedimenticola sp.]